MNNGNLELQLFISFVYFMKHKLLEYLNITLYIKILTIALASSLCNEIDIYLKMVLNSEKLVRSFVLIIHNSMLDTVIVSLEYTSSQHTQFI